MVKKKYILTGEDCNIWHLIQFQHLNYLSYSCRSLLNLGNTHQDSWFWTRLYGYKLVYFCHILLRVEKIWVSFTYPYTVISNMVVCLNTTPPSLQYINLISKYLLVWPFSHERTSRVRYSMLSFVKSLNIHSNRVYMKCWNFLWDNGQLSKYQIKR